MASRKNLYDVLGVARDATADEIKKSYRKLARQFHPDVNPGDAPAEERFKEISEAYAVLSDAERRSAYDEFGDVALDAGFDAEAARRAREQFGARFGGGAPGPGFEGMGDFGAEAFQFGNLDDLLGNLFGGRGGFSPRPQRGPDLEAELRLGLRDAALGGEQRITLSRPTAEGMKSETIQVRVPAGMSDGSRIRLAGKGGEAPGGAGPGDLYVTIRLEPHSVFRVEERDLHLDLPVTIREATLGAKVEVPTLEGRATLTVPPGSEGGQRLRLRGKGLPAAQGKSAGDLYVTLRIRVPRNLDDAGRAHLDALAEYDPSDLRKGLFE